MCAASVFASDRQLSDLIDRVRVLFVEANNRPHDRGAVGLVAILIAADSMPLLLLLQSTTRHAGDHDGDDDGDRCYPSTSLDKLHDHQIHL